MEDGSPIIIAAVGIILAAFAILLTVRLVNRGKKPSARFCVCFVLVIAVGALSICLPIWLPYHREQQIVEKIKGWGGYVGILEVVDGPEWLRRLVGDNRMKVFKVFERIGIVQLEIPEITDAEIAQLSGLTNLHCLFVNDTAVTDAGLDHLSRFTNLETLHLDRTAVTDAGLAHLSELRKLKYLSLDSTGVADAGLVQLSRSPNLEFLSLQDTAVTDAGLVHLSRLTNLEELWLGGTAVTDEGIEKLQRTLPDCEIRH